MGRGFVPSVAAGVLFGATLACGRADAPVRESSRVDTVSIRLRERHQVMLGWEAVAQIGAGACDDRAFARYRGVLLERAVDELGLNRIRVELKSGAETRRAVPAWYAPQNDNADPRVADPAGFNFSAVDQMVDAIVIPLRTALDRRGERLYVNLTYVDFSNFRAAGTFAQMKDPAEWAELLESAFVHWHDRYGWVPDAVEAVLEPEHTPYTPADIGRAIVAAGDRLRAAGFSPEFVAPSTTSMANAVRYWDAMVRVPRVREYVRELAYHRYAHRSRPTLRRIATLGSDFSVRTAMLEHIAGDVDELLEDLTIGNVSSWQQFALAFCHAQSGPDDGTVYFAIDQSDPLNPRVELTRRAKLLSQVFRHVRAGSVRVGVESPPNAASVGFVDPKGRAVVVVRSRSETNVLVRGLPPSRYAVSYADAARTGIDLPDVVVAGDSIARVRVPAGAVLTLHGRD